MTLHPREPRGFDRRQFLQRSAAAALGLSSAGTLLAACGGDETTRAGGTGAADTVTPEDSPFQLARRDNPVTLPLFDDNPPIEAGLEPESGDTLKRSKPN